MSWAWQPLLPATQLLATPPTTEGGFRSFTMFWVGGLAALSTATGQPIIKRTATVPFLGGSLRRGGW